MLRRKQSREILRVRAVNQLSHLEFQLEQSWFAMRYIEIPSKWRI